MTHHGDDLELGGAWACPDVRLALSARLDGEDPMLPHAALRSHLSGCVACAAWLAGAERVETVLRSAGPEAPDLTGRVLAALAADRAAAGVAAASGAVPGVAVAEGSGRLAPPRLAARVAARLGLEPARVLHGLRWGVGLVAAVQLIFAVPILVGVLIGDAHGEHASREMASFDVAMAVGFLLAALRPAQARAFVPVAFILAACLAMTSTIDLINGNTMLIHELSHLVAIGQGVMLWLLSRSGTEEPDRPGFAATARAH
jgi:predicted anti-sigma-YlaC factor YlaD